MTCIIIAFVISCTGQAPKLTPAQAAAVLAPHQFTYVASPGYPRSGSTASKGPTAGPWNFPPPSPPRRLDGTLLTQPPTVYGRTYIGRSRR